MFFSEEKVGVFSYRRIYFYFYTCGFMTCKWYYRFSHFYIHEHIHDSNIVAGTSYAHSSNHSTIL
jgi:hypothetical protein